MSIIPEHVPEGPSWDSKFADPEPLDTDWAASKLAIGWSLFRIASHYMLDDGGFTAELFDWLCAHGSDGDEVARFARTVHIEKEEFESAIVHTGPKQGQLKEAFISEAPFRSQPTGRTPSREVAAYLDDLIVDYPWEQWSDDDERRQYIRLCRENGWHWPQVAIALRRRRIVAIEKNTSGKGVELSELGIPVYTDRFPQPQPICPLASTYFHIGHFTTVTYDKPCGSPSCARCGPKSADRLLRMVDWRIRDLPVVYITEATWDRNLSTRLGQRRKAHGIDTFTYRAANDVVTVVSDKPICGTSEPKVSRAMSPQEAYDYLRDQVLWVPGRASQSWSEGWAPIPQGDGMSLHVSMRGLGPDGVERFKRLALDEATTHYGYRPGVAPIPPEDWVRFRAFCIELRDRLASGG